MKLISLFYCCEEGFYQYKYMNVWEKFDETSLAKEEDYYSHLNM